MVRHFEIPSRRVQLTPDQKFGRLTPIRFDKMIKNRSHWLFLCDCGNVVSRIAFEVTSGSTSSCGCLRKEVTAKLKFSHGFGALKGPLRKFYQSWANMIQRCTNPSVPGYKDYGGRGIKVCDRWLNSFENYKQDNYDSYIEHAKIYGEKDTTLDRIEVNGNYEVSNVRWATKAEQSLNTTVSTISLNYREHCLWKDKLHTGIRAILFQNRKQSIYFKYLGCNSEQLKRHIELQFEPWMNWDNHGHADGKWEIDFIISCNKFDLSLEEDRLKCFHYTNIRPYDAIKNRERTYLEKR